MGAATDETQETQPEPDDGAPDAGELEPDAQPDPGTEPVPETAIAVTTTLEGRCDAETTVSGTPYRCALDSEHDGRHDFQPATAEVDEPKPVSAWAPQSEREIEKAQDALTREAERHARRIREILGADADDLAPCDLCSQALAGWRTDTAPTPEVVARVRVAIGLPDVSNFQASDTEAVCRSCGGLGKVRTGSLVAAYETASCDSCEGRGFTETRARHNAAPGDRSETSQENGDTPPPDDGIIRDMFGTPYGDPDYGLMAHMRARPTDYWQTHRA